MDCMASARKALDGMNTIKDLQENVLTIPGFRDALLCMQELYGPSKETKTAYENVAEFFRKHGFNITHDANWSYLYTISY